MISPDQVAEGVKNTEYLWGLSLVDYLEQGMIENSGRVANRLLNTLLHRDERFEEIKVRTMTDRVEAAGLAYIESENAWATKVLMEQGWDPETLQPLEGTDTLKHVGSVNELSDDQKAARMKCVEQINSKRIEEARIPEDAENIWEVEPDPRTVVMLSLDGVGAKRQKDTRPKEAGDKAPDYIHDDNDGPADFTRAPDPKGRPKVETAVAHIEVDAKKYLFVGKNMFMVCKFVLAFLLSNKLLIDRQLLILSDGGMDIRKCVNGIFAFCPHVVVLDWFHLRKHCYESLSMALLSGKANRAMQYEVRRHLFHILWVGNVDGAIAYLNSLGPDKVPPTKRKYLDSLIEYLKKNKDRHVIACYAMRARLGLRISSNPVEKANDLIVSSRQKGDCMSWSRFGSWGLAAVTCMYLNHEAEHFHLHHAALHEMYTEYGKVFDLKDERYKKGA